MRDDATLAVLPCLVNPLIGEVRVTERSIVEASHSPALYFKGLGFFVQREEELVRHVAQDLDEALGLAELQDVIEQRILALLEALHEAELADDYSELDAVAGLPHLVRAGPAPLRVLFEVFPRLH